jgi:hypothetical protein
VSSIAAPMNVQDKAVPVLQSRVHIRTRDDDDPDGDYVRIAWIAITYPEGSDCYRSRRRE